MTNPAGIDLATGEGVFVSTHVGGDLSLMLEVVGRGSTVRMQLSAISRCAACAALARDDPRMAAFDWRSR